MAFRCARSLLTLVISAVLLVGAAVAAQFAGATPKSPATPATKPDIATVQRELGQLAVSNSELVEQYNQARITTVTAQRAATAATAAARTANAVYARANGAFARTVQAQYESGGMTTGGALLASSSGTDYLSRLDTIRLLSNHDANVVGRVAQARSSAVSAASAAASALRAAQAAQARLGTQKSRVTGQMNRYRTMLASLTSAQQYAYQRAANPSVSARKLANQDLPQATSAGAQRAVQFALAQVGKPYVYGAAGPGSFDCSGLTMSAWRAGGVSLPHSAADQYNYGHHVAPDQLQPGDLIFFYQPIGHVTIYIGNGYMVSAPTEGENVSVVPLDAFGSDYAGATRLT